MWRKAAMLAMAGALWAAENGSASADMVACRPNALGTVSCPAAPPRPRPPETVPVPRGLDGVRARTETPPGEAFVPAGRTGGLGGVVLRRGAGATDCRRDTLGNLICR